MSDLDEPIHVVPHDPTWADQFLALRQELRKLLPDGARVAHVGSTAVPGLDAKPVIDVLVGLESWHEAGPTAERLAAGGWTDLGRPGELERWMLRRRGEVDANVHLVEADAGLWRDNLLLRDHLVTVPSARARYAATKRAAIAAGATSLLTYSEHKAATVTQLLREARLASR